MIIAVFIVIPFGKGLIEYVSITCVQILIHWVLAILEFLQLQGWVRLFVSHYRVLLINSIY